MTDETDDTIPAAEPAPPAQPDMFGVLLELLKFVNDAKAVEARLSELGKEGRRIARARTS
jgi:hypothetical protein